MHVRRLGVADADAAAAITAASLTAITATIYRPTTVRALQLLYDAASWAATAAGTTVGLVAVDGADLLGVVRVTLPLTRPRGGARRDGGDRPPGGDGDGNGGSDDGGHGSGVSGDAAPAVLSALFVHPAACRRGVGAALVAATEAVAAAAGARAVSLLSSTTAVVLYWRCGYAASGLPVGQDDPLGPALPMAKALPLPGGDAAAAAHARGGV